VSPTFDHLINGLMNRVTGVSSAVAAAHKQLIVSRVTVADGRNHSGGQSLRFEPSPGRRATHPTAAAQRSVYCDNSRFSRRTARKQFQNRFCNVRRELAVILSAPHLVPFAASYTLLGIRKAFLFGARQGSLLDQDALAFVPST
jgi:hypothetical protein